MKVERIAHLTGHDGAVFALAEGSHPEQIFSGAGDGWVVAWDLRQPDLGKLVAKVERSVFSLHFLPEKNQIVAGDMDGGVRFIDLNTPDQTRNIKHHSKGTFSIQTIDNQLLTIGGDGTITRWSAEQQRSLESLQLTTKALRSLDYSAATNRLILGASDGSVFFLDAKNWENFEVLTAIHPPSVFSAKFLTPDLWLSGGRDAHLRLWYKSEALAALPAHLFTVNDIVFHPTDTSIFATASRDKTIKIWKIWDLEASSMGQKPAPRIELLKVIDTIRHGCHIRSVNRLLWSHYNNYLISASDDRSLMVWAIA
jgi:WD repeat-containing protein 61